MCPLLTWLKTFQNPDYSVKQEEEVPGLMEAWIRSDVHYFLMTHHIKSGWENPCDVTKSRDHAISPEILAPAVFGNFRIVCRSCFALNFDMCNINMLNGRGLSFFLNDWFLKLSVHCWCQSHQESFPTILVHVKSKNVLARVCVYVFGGRGSCARIYDGTSYLRSKFIKLLLVLII